jgi:MoxR-like ATPase
LTVGYQDAAAERDIIALRAPALAARHGHELAEAIIADAVELTRRTRTSEYVRQGSSVRGAIDLALVVSELLDSGGDVSESEYRSLICDSLLLALSGRITLRGDTTQTAEEILIQIWEDYFTHEPAAALEPV